MSSRAATEGSHFYKYDQSSHEKSQGEARDFCEESGGAEAEASGRPHGRP